LHDAHQPEYFELRLIFGFEQSSFGCRKKPSLTFLMMCFSVVFLPAKTLLPDISLKPNKNKILV